MTLFANSSIQIDSLDPHCNAEQMKPSLLLGACVLAQGYDEDTGGIVKWGCHLGQVIAASSSLFLNCSCFCSSHEYYYTVILGIFH